MNGSLPYEKQLQQQWIDLPLPDEDRAWADMKRRLEEDDDDGIIAWWRRGCVAGGFLLLVLLAMGWWVLQPRKWFSNAYKPGPATHQENSPGQQGPKDSISTIEDNSRYNPSNENSNPVKPDTGDLQHDSLPVTQGIIISEDSDRPVSSKSTAGANKEPRAIVSKQTGELVVKTNAGRSVRRPTVKKQVEAKVDTRNQDPQTGINNQNPGMPVDHTIPVTAEPAGTKTDSVPAPVKPGTLTQTKRNKDSLPTPVVKRDSTKKKIVFFSAGIAMHQQLPVAGQNFTPYSSSGRKGTLADYIPAVYFRVNKKDKWFLQSEFRYGAPQYTKDFLYHQKSDSTAQLGKTITSSRLKKTYYHQLPVTFNYYVLPNWAIGAGLSWNKFTSAVAEEEVIKPNSIIQPDSLVSRLIVRSKNDSAFAKSYFQAVFETQYQWKKFSLGARYSFGLQPYIKFTLPGGAQQQERNTSLQVFLRYQFWKSKDRAKR